jgi:formylmethanofuran dehydrogenase subunit C
MPLTLAPRDGDGPAPLAVDLDGLIPEAVRGLDLPAIARLKVRADGLPCEIGAIFTVAGDPAGEHLVCRGDFSRVHRIGADMTRGRIDVTGSAGRHAGAGMAGGTLAIAGDAGDWLAAEMAGGEVRVGGHAGDNTAAALPGSDQGVRGGIVIVSGSVGSLAGARMRRGILAIGGACGPAAGFELRAGTVFVAGAVGPQPGLGMRRGSLLALSPPPRMPPTFVRGCSWSPPFLPLLAARLARSGFQPGFPPSGTPWRQWHGDGLTGGRGEILHPDTEPETEPATAGGFQRP